MATFKSGKAYTKSLRKRVSKTEKDAARVVAFAAKKGIAMMKTLAPTKTGETINGINALKIGKATYSIISDVTPKGTHGFKQNMWSNRRPPHEKPKMWWNQHQPTLYGDGSHRITGVPGWFDLVAVELQKEFPELAISIVRRDMAKG